MICKTCKIEKTITDFKYNCKVRKNCISCRRAKNYKLSKPTITGNESKICKQCNINKHINFFDKKIDGLFGVRTICKDCSKNNRVLESNNSTLVEIRRNYDRKYKLKNKNNTLFRLKSNLRKRIYSFCKEKHFKKNTKTLDMLGTTIEEFKIYIESKFDANMSWDNYGKYWHIDHIIPLSSAKNEKDMIDLCHYTNLQPLEAISNMKKGAKYFKFKT